MAYLMSRNFGKIKALQNLCLANFNTLQNVKTSSKLITATTKNIISKPKLSQSLIIRNFSLSTPRMAGHGGNHAALWKVERIVSLVLLGIIPIGIIIPSQPLDYLMAISIVMHQHWGIEAIITDYVRPILFGHAIPKMAHLLLIVISVATLGGLFYFSYKDIGIGKAVRKLWAVNGR